MTDSLRFSACVILTHHAWKPRTKLEPEVQFAQRLAENRLGIVFACESFGSIYETQAKAISSLDVLRRGDGNWPLFQSGPAVRAVRDGSFG